MIVWAFAGDTGHFHNEIDLPCSEAFEGMEVDTNRASVVYFVVSPLDSL